MNNFTFPDMRGRRRPRRFVLAGGLIILGLLALARLGQPETATVRNKDTSPIHNISYEILPDEPAVRQAFQDQNVCPAQPEHWAWADIFPGDHYRLIRTPCILTGIARTAAWMLAERMGYSKTEAAELMGFESLPWSPQREILAFANLSGPNRRSLQTEWPAHPDYFFWQVDVEGRPAVTLSLRGCYLLDNTAYCVLAMDRLPGAAISVLGEFAFASHAGARPANRSFYVLVHMPGGDWHLVGQFADTTIDVRNAEELATERMQFLDRLGVEVWDADWLFAHYAIAMKALPDQWRLLGMAEEDVQSISDRLNLYLPNGEGGTDD